MNYIPQIDILILFCILYLITIPTMYTFGHIMRNFTKTSIAFYWTILVFVPLIGPLLYVLMKPWRRKKEKRTFIYFRRR